MRRCPDCGFRARDIICPLCGVRMREDPVICAHAHVQSGERCGVQLQENRRPAEYRPAVRQPTSGKRRRAVDDAVRRKLISIAVGVGIYLLWIIITALS